jgi:hypothetical protein
MSISLRVMGSNLSGLFLSIRLYIYIATSNVVDSFYFGRSWFALKTLISQGCSVSELTVGWDAQLFVHWVLKVLSTRHRWVLI